MTVSLNEAVHWEESPTGLEKTTCTPLRGIYNIKGTGIPPKPEGLGLLPDKMSKTISLDQLPRQIENLLRALGRT